MTVRSCWVLNWKRSFRKKKLFGAKFKQLSVPNEQFILRKGTQTSHLHQPKSDHQLTAYARDSREALHRGSGQFAVTIHLHLVHLLTVSVTERSIVQQPL